MDLFKKIYWDEQSIPSTPVFSSCADRPQDKGAKDVIEAYTEIDNVASERVLTKAGFKRAEKHKTLVKVIDETSGEKEEVKLNFWSLERPSSM
jgi:RimJ/RimL family protein N-acetyltransferase